jgi:hypothetical protein
MDANKVLWREKYSLHSFGTLKDDKTEQAIYFDIHE